jgi:hypothetical protein
MKNIILKSKIGRVALAAAVGGIISAGCATQQPQNMAEGYPQPVVEQTIDLSRTGPSTHPGWWDGAYDLNQQWWNIESFE